MPKYGPEVEVWESVETNSDLAVGIDLPLGAEWDDLMESVIQQILQVSSACATEPEVEVR